MPLFQPKNSAPGTPIGTVVPKQGLTTNLIECLSRFSGSSTDLNTMNWLSRELKCKFAYSSTE